MTDVNDNYPAPEGWEEIDLWKGPIPEGCEGVKRSPYPPLDSLTPEQRARVLRRYPDAGGRVVGATFRAPDPLDVPDKPHGERRMLDDGSLAPTVYPEDLPVPGDLTVPEEWSPDDEIRDE